MKRAKKKQIKIKNKETIINHRNRIKIYHHNKRNLKNLTLMKLLNKKCQIKFKRNLKKRKTISKMRWKIISKKKRKTISKKKRKQKKRNLVKMSREFKNCWVNLINKEIL